MAESVVLAGLELNDNTNYVLEAFTVPPPRKRLEWVSGADSSGAVLGREALYDNRTVAGRVRVAEQTTMDLALAKLHALVLKLQEAEKGGVDCVWTPKNSTKSGTLKVLTGEVDTLPVVEDGDGVGWFQNQPIVDFTLTCKPGIRGSEVTGTPASSTLPLMTIELTQVAGELPADTRLVVTDNATQSRRHVEFGVESRYYPTSSPPGLILDSDSLVTTGFGGTGATRTGAYDPGAAGNSVIRASLATQPVAVCGTGVQTHVGVFRVKARIWVAAFDTTSTSVRLAWQDGDGPVRANSYVSPGVANAFSEVDLGTIKVDPVILGTQRWTGRIEAFSTVVGDTVDVDYLMLIPAAEGYGLIRSDYSYRPGTLVARDEFAAITAGTALSGRVAPVGGTWATSGVATDFVAADIGSTGDETMERSTVGAEATPRFAILGSTTYTNVEVSVRVRFDATGNRQELIFAWTDANNYARLRLYHGSLLTGWMLETVVAGVATVVASGAGRLNTRNRWYGLRAIRYTSGTVIGQILSANGNVAAQIAGTSTVLATGGTLAGGKVGFSDMAEANGTGNPGTRDYDNFAVATPDPEPIAIYSTRQLEVRSDVAKRQDSTGTYTGDPPTYRGSPRPSLPPAGAGARKVRIAVKARRNDVLVGADDQIADSLTVVCHHTPVWLTAPG